MKPLNAKSKVVRNQYLSLFVRYQLYRTAVTSLENIENDCFSFYRINYADLSKFSEGKKIRDCDFRISVP